MPESDLDSNILDLLIYSLIKVVGAALAMEAVAVAAVTEATVRPRFRICILIYIY